MLDKKLVSGIEKLDKQHEDVILGISALKKGVEAQAPKKEIIELIKKLKFYADEHFEYEEQLAEVCNFYRIEEFKDAHNDFKNHYTLIKKFYDLRKHHTPRIYALLIVNVLESWIEFHFEHIEYDFIDTLKDCIAKGLDISNI